MLLAAMLASVLIAGCGGSGHSADSPTGGVTLVPGDGVITASWAMEPGVDYWMFWAPSSSISPSNWTTTIGSKSVINVTSPFIATDLSNGTVYSFTVNGRVKGGPGGAGTPSVSAVPRLAGTAPAPWTAGTVLGANDMRGVAWGATFVAVGAGGVMYSSPDSVTWTAIASPVTSNLNATIFSGVYSAVGDGGVILYSTDAVTWTTKVSGTAGNLYGIAGGVVAGVGRLVAVGAGGTILYSADGSTWAVAASSGKVTTKDLYAVKYYTGGLFIAVGDAGTILTSTDATNWTQATSNTTLNLKDVTGGTNATTAAAVFVAVGANGVLVTSPDTVTWTSQPKIGTGANTLNAVTYRSQFIAVGSGGAIFTSTDGTTWASQNSTTSANLNAIVPGPYWYSVVGAAGTNLLAK
jgi:hypothetical protein